MKSFNDFRVIYEIDINKDFVNQLFQTVIEGSTFKIEIRTLNDNILLIVKKGEEIIVPMNSLKTLFPLNIVTFHKWSQGYFFVTGNKNNEINLKSYPDLRLFCGLF